VFSLYSYWDKEFRKTKYISISEVSKSNTAVRSMNSIREVPRLKPIQRQVIPIKGFHDSPVNIGKF
jgi:hypothetical protein